jgi:hypothetical protein
MVAAAGKKQGCIQDEKKKTHYALIVSRGPGTFRKAHGASDHLFFLWVVGFPSFHPFLLPTFKFPLQGFSLTCFSRK